MKKLSFFILLASLLALNACKDTSEPLIILDGEYNMSHVLNEPFTDPGYMAFDDEDGEVTENVTVSELDVNMAGKQIITYTVSDVEGNTATAERKVTVYNEAESDFKGKWYAEYIQPYPGAAIVAYNDSITASESQNMDIIIHNFAESGSDINAAVVLQGGGKTPILEFDTGITSDYAPITDNLQRITIDYTLNGERGVVVLVKRQTKNIINLKDLKL